LKPDPSKEFRRLYLKKPIMKMGWWNGLSSRNCFLARVRS
jgi:hypothetical protein